MKLHICDDVYFYICNYIKDCINMYFDILCLFKCYWQLRIAIPYDDLFFHFGFLFLFVWLLVFNVLLLLHSQTIFSWCKFLLMHCNVNVFLYISTSITLRMFNKLQLLCVFATNLFTCVSYSKVSCWFTFYWVQLIWPNLSDLDI